MGLKPYSLATLRVAAAFECRFSLGKDNCIPNLEIGRLGTKGKAPMPLQA
jgi:hypothetical protein